MFLGCSGYFAATILLPASSRLTDFLGRLLSPCIAILSDSGTTDVAGSSREIPDLLVRSTLARRCLFSKSTKEMLHGIVLEHCQEQNQLPYKKQISHPDSVGTRWLPEAISSTPLRIHTHGPPLKRSHRSLPSPERLFYDTHSRFNIPTDPTECSLQY